MTPRIVDCVMFRDETQMLLGRLEELSSLPGYHLILVEAPVTHTGAPKPLVFAENADLFAPWKDRITHVVAEGLDPALAAWPREHAQRDAAIPALEALDLDRDDIVLIADVDEFPPQGFDWGAVSPVVSFRQRLAMYAVDWLYPDLHVCTVAARWGLVKGRSLAALRDNRGGYAMADGGWHLTWLGGLEGQRAKLAVSCHNLGSDMTLTEYDRIYSGACYERGAHHGDGSRMMIPADVDESWPRFIWERRCPESWFRPRAAGQAGSSPVLT